MEGLTFGQELAILIVANVIAWGLCLHKSISNAKTVA